MQLVNFKWLNYSQLNQIVSKFWTCFRLLLNQAVVLRLGRHEWRRRVLVQVHNLWGSLNQVCFDVKNVLYKCFLEYLFYQHLIWPPTFCCHFKCLCKKSELVTFTEKKSISTYKTYLWVDIFTICPEEKTFSHQMWRTDFSGKCDWLVLKEEEII